MNTSIRAAAAAILVGATGSAAQAAQLAYTATSIAGSYNGDIAVLDDGFIPALGDFWQDNTVWTNYGSAPYSFEFDFGGLVTVDDFVLSLDNNDDYELAFYNGATLLGSVPIGAGDGLVGGGMDVFGTFSPVPNGGTLIAFGSVTATRAVLTSGGGDGAYGIGEVQFFNNAAVPEPASWAMMIAGFALAGGALRARRQGANVRFA